MMTPAHDAHNGPSGCSGYEALIARAADGSTDVADDATLEVHLATCEKCRLALEAQRSVVAALAVAYEMEPSPGFAARVSRQVPPRDRGLDRLDFRAWTWRFSPVAAGLAVAAWLVVTSDQPAFAGNAADAEYADSTMLWSEAVGENDIVTSMLDADAPDPGTEEESQQ